VRYETARCLIRPFEEQDVDAFIAYRNNAAWMRFQGFKNLTKAEYQKQLLVPPNPWVGCQLAVTRRADGKLLGDLYLKREPEGVWIGYTLHPTYTGQGFAFEAVQGLLLYLQGMDHPRVFAGVMAENIASIRLLLRLGFQFDGTEADGELRYAYPQ